MKNITKEAGMEEDIMPFMVNKLTEADKKLVVRGIACVTLNKKKLEPSEAMVIQQLGNVLNLDPGIVEEVTTNW